MVKRRWSIHTAAAAPVTVYPQGRGGISPRTEQRPRTVVAAIVEQPVRRVSPSSFVDVRRQHEGNNAALGSTAALLRAIVAGALREVPMDH